MLIAVIKHILILGYLFADDDYDLEEDEKTEVSKQSTDDHNGILNIANGEIKKLKEEMAPEAKKELSGSVLNQDAAEPLESIAEQADEADKSVHLVKNGMSH